MNHSTYILASLARNKLRTTLTVLSLVSAFVLFGLLQPVKQVFTEGPRLAEAGRLIVAPKYSIADMLPQRIGEQIAQVPGVAITAHMTWFGGTYIEQANFFPQYAVTPEAFLQAMPELRLSTDARAAFIRSRQGAVMGRATAIKYGFAVGDVVPLIPTIWHNHDGGAWQFELVGIFDTEPGSLVTDDAMYFNYAYFDEYRALAQGTVSHFLVKAKSPIEMPSIARRIDQLTMNSSAETKTMTDQEYALSFAQQMGNVGLIVDVVLAAVFFTILLVTSHAISQATRERMPELAVMQILGFKSASVIGVVLAEVGLIMVVSVALGLLAAQLMLGLAVESVPSLAQLGAMAVEWQIVFRGVGVALLIGFIVALPSAWRLWRLNIVDALRV